MERQGIIAKVFPGIFLPFSLLPARKISPQHQTSTTLFQTCGRSRTTPPISPFLAHFPTSTPKPRAEGSSPSAPAKNGEVSICLPLHFSLVGGMSWQPGTAAPRAVRVVGRVRAGGTQATSRPRRQPRPSPSAPATKPAKTLGFRRFSFCLCCMGMGFVLVRIPGFLTRPHLPHSPLAPETHPVSPFSDFSGCVFAFFAVLWVQNFWHLFLFILPICFTG